MPNWTQILEELSKSPRKDAIDSVRGKYLQRLQKYTGRNVIAYYSGWLEQVSSPKLSISDLDMNAFMNTVNGLDTSIGLDLILHTPGGDIAATEAIVRYLHDKFGTDIRVIVPQIAMSAGTMIACASKEIIMGKQSNLGPIDPQFGSTPAQGVLDEYKKAKEEIVQDPRTTPYWQTLLAKYPPTFLGECKLAVEWSEKLVADWLSRNMLAGESPVTISGVVSQLLDHDSTKSHGRHLGLEKCREIGLKILAMEDDQDLQDNILSVHHAFMHTFSASSIPVAKIVENHKKARIVYFAQVK